MSYQHRLRGITGALVAALGLAATLGIGSAAHAQALPGALLPAPDGLGFYQPPAQMPARNGDIIWARRSNWPRNLLANYEVKAWQVLYRSTTVTGAPVAVSGTIIVPQKAFTGPRPIVGWAPGTKGIGDHCATSRNITKGSDYDAPFIMNALDRGWAVAVTDYEGLGTPGDHVYVVGRALGRNVLDVVRAATRLTEANLSSAARIALFGYSEGGAASLWAATLRPSYAPELNVLAAAAGGVPADLPAVANHNDGQLFSGIQLYAAAGYAKAYGLPLEDVYDPSNSYIVQNNILNGRGHAALRTARNDCLFEVSLSLAFTQRRNLTDNRVDLVTEPAWAQRFAENKLGNIVTGLPPLHLFHGINDQAVPFTQARNLRSTYCQAGVNVEWQQYSFAEHGLGLALGIGNAIRFIQTRFDYGAITDNCPANP